MENNKILYGYSLLNILWTIKDVAGAGGGRKNTKLIMSESNLCY